MSDEARAPANPRTTTRTTLNREQVLRAAMSFADRDGIDALSMRKLGRELGVEAMSLYNHVAGKDDMLDGMAELVWGEVKLPSPKGDWRAAIRGTGVSAHTLLVRHPWACSLTISSGRPHLARLRYIDAILGRLATAGFSDTHAYHAYHAIDSHIVGFSMWVNGHSLSAVQRSEPAAQTMLRNVAEQLPHLAEHIRQHRSDVGSGVDEFSLVLDFILDGLDQTRAEGPRQGSLSASDGWLRSGPRPRGRRR